MLFHVNSMIFIWDFPEGELQPAKGFLWDVCEIYF